MNDASLAEQRSKSQLVYWIFQLTGWGVYSLSRFFGGVTVIHLPWVHFGLQLLMVDALGFGLSHVLRHYVRPMNCTSDTYCKPSLLRAGRPAEKSKFRSSVNEVTALSPAV